MKDTFVLLHNPRCRKSREGHAYLEENNIKFTIRRYLEDPLSVNELQEIIAKLGKSPSEILRKNEPAYKEHIKGKELSNINLIDLMVSYPKLIERPILVGDNEAVIGRPKENFDFLIG